MKLLPKHIKKKLPALYSQENISDPIVYVKYFDPAGTWTSYAAEGKELEKDDFLFFGYVVGHEPELGCFTLNQLKTAKEGINGISGFMPIERDLYFTPCRLSEVKKLHNIV